MADKDYLHSLQSFERKHRRMPTYAEMAKLFGFRSKNAVYKVVQKLLDAGAVKKDHLGRLIAGQRGGVALLGQVTAGFPAMVEDAPQETIALEDYLMPQGDVYMLTVDGDSMINAHIADGDTVLVQRTRIANDGDIVVACIDGEWTMKYFKKNSKDEVWLEPANERFSNLYPEHSLEIGGVVKAVIRRYE